MNDSELKSLLHRAQTGTADFRLDDLAGKVRELDWRRRRRARRISIAATVVLVGAVVTGWSVFPRGAIEHDRAVADGVDAQDIERLEAEAQYHERLARRLMADRERARAVAEARGILRQPDPVDEVREQIDVVAYRMVLRGDGLREKMDPEAIGVYRGVVRLFPNTHSAELARKRLSELGATKGES
jgi:hypothetical protein